MTEHPISLPPKLWDKWIEDGCDGFLAACEAARWGADQELEACISAVLNHPGFEQPELFVELLRATRRPKPPSLAEQALDVLNLMLMFLPPGDQREQGETIRRALERLQELEEGNE